MVTYANSEIGVRVRHDSGGSVNIVTQYANLNTVYVGEL